MSLRLRLTLFYSAFFAIILTAVAISVYLLTESSLTDALEDRAQQALVDLQRGEFSSGLLKLPGNAYHQILLIGDRGSTSISVAQVRNGIDLPQPGFENPTDDALVSMLNDADLERLIAGEGVSFQGALAGGETLRILGDIGVLGYALNDRILEFNAAIFIGIPAGNTTTILERLGGDLGLTVVIAFVVFGIGVFLLSRQVLSPVQRVTHAASRVTGRDLSQRVPVPRTADEMRDLAVTINRMLERLQESFETQRRFTADASHELRTPVTAIVGHTNYLLRRTRPNPEQVDSLTVIRREAERMAKLVNDLLELARADAGFSILKEPCNLVEVLEAVHMELAPVAGHAEITVNAPQERVEVIGDPSRLKQVVLNLVLNALNAGADRVGMTLYRDRGTVRLEVLDNGPGIPEAAIPHLFERFYRVDGARSTRGNGSGLGLAIVKWIVQQHGGRVGVESRLGEGSVFTVELDSPNARLSEANAVRQTLTETLAIFRSGRETRGD
jgi:signal transduction histidine kinase